MHKCQIVEPSEISNQGELQPKLTQEKRHLWLVKLNKDLRGRNLYNNFVRPSHVSEPLIAEAFKCRDKINCISHIIRCKMADLQKKNHPDWVTS